ncbi:hypothetical protein FOYG_14098 [Fusarium oxysporum NRRL 32931]|uniref:Uncharacterized protein n=1 Tax=Fusarium oxysporum NRRL 32931 TaxID=660029 RepID=W9HVV2_FUSOX|nr:hypothetical protein FOYG_14098 [Fusarium oxysporum NRRL 32931]
MLSLPDIKCRHMLLPIFFLHKLGVGARAFRPRDTSFDWASIKAQPDLDWAPCYENFTCTKLEVPLDYSNSRVGTTEIAFIKYSPSDVSNQSQDLILNFGGPGGSGIEATTSYISAITSLLGSNYNIVSFDPRGVGHSGPVVDCFPNNAEARQNFANDFYGETINASSTSLATQFYSSALFGEWCTEAIGRNDTRGLHISTPAVAQDLLTYAKAKQRAAGKEEADAQIWYYGMSYGTVLGTTFASLFPEHVGRIILDGVVDAEDYYQNGWKSNLYQTDQALAKFSTFCHEAGPNKCSFWGPSAQNISDRLDDILASLKKNPIPVTSLGDSGSSTTGMATYSDLKTIMLESLYQPVAQFPVLSDTLIDLEKGIGFDPSLASDFLLGPDVNSLIKCIDGYDQNNISSVRDYWKYTGILTSQSQYFGEVWPNNAGPALCRSLQLDIPNIDKYKASGPFLPSASKTSNPLLFISSSIDPVAPVVGAHKMSRGFVGSVVLIQEAVGHTAIAQGGSDCMFKHIQAYLNDSRKLPPADTVCEMQLVPFKDQLVSEFGV